MYDAGGGGKPPPPVNPCRGAPMQDHGRAGMLETNSHQAACAMRLGIIALRKKASNINMVQIAVL